MILPDLSDIRRLRAAAGLTQSQLARATGVPQSVISKLEAGKLDPSYSNAAKLFEYFAQAQKTQGKTAQQLMHAPIVGLKPSDKVGEAMRLMARHAISTLPVLQDGRVAGHVSEDLILEHSGGGQDISSWPVSRLMGEPLARIAPGTPAEVVREMLLHSKAVIVTRGEKAAGIITKADLLKLLR
jgi:predicted transcriptional regulator